MASIKKHLTVLVVFLWFVTPGFAQTWSEWFSQKKTQIKYLTQQIAALEQYNAYLKQGYAISQNGLGGIDGWLKSEYSLHSRYYSSLSTVNPVIKCNSKADTITATISLIPPQFTRIKKLKGLDINTKAYIKEVSEKVFQECDRQLNELQIVITDGKTQMTDDERIKRIDHVYEQVRDLLKFSQYFCSHIKVLILQRSFELNNIQTLKNYYENN